MASFQDLDVAQLGVTTTEDLMELSSELNPPTNAEDIDIDTSTNDLPQEHDDDQMAEDINSVTDQELPDVDALEAGNDDEMFDNDYSSGEFQEGFSIVDEAVVDAEGIEDVEDATIGSDANASFAGSDESAVQQIIQTDSTIQNREEIDVAVTDRVALENSMQHLDNTPKQASVIDPTDQPSQSSAALSTSSPQGDNPPRVLETSPIESSNNANASRGVRDSQSKDQARTPGTGDTHYERSVSPREGQLATVDIDDSIAPNASVSQDSPYVHPVVVVYQDNEMSLFPPVDQDEEHSQTYFLQDESYALGSISNLLGACRSLLGESINEQDELEIRIEELGLQISESTPESSTTTLTDILDLYVQLQHHDGLENPGPLYLVLCTKIMFSQRMRYLVNAVAEGKGISQLPLLELPDDNSPQFEDVEQQADGIEKDLHDQSSSPYGEVEEYLPYNLPDTDREKEDGTDSSDHKTSQRTQLTSKGSVPNLGAPGIEPRLDGAPLEHASKITQFPRSREVHLGANDASTIEEQRLIPQAEMETAKLSSADNHEPAPRVSSAVDVENDDVINYNDEGGEDDVTHDLSTRSSTIQGDSIEGSKFEVATITEKVPNNDLAESWYEPNWEHEYQIVPFEQEQAAKGTSDVSEADEGLEPGDGEYIGVDQQGEISEFESDEHEANHIQEDCSGRSPTNDIKAPRNATYEDSQTPELQIESVFTDQVNEENQNIQFQENDIKGNEPPSEQGVADVHTELHNQDDSREDLYEFSVDDLDTGKATRSANANGTVSNGNSNGNEHNLDHSSSTLTNRSQPGHIPHKLIRNDDQIDYSDDEDGSALPTLPIEQGLSASPESLKRLRSDMEDDAQDPKRNRSR